MLRRLSYLILALLLPLGAAAQKGIAEDFAPVCDSLSRLIYGRCGVDGQLKVQKVMKRNGYLDFYFDHSLGDFPWRKTDYEHFVNNLKNLFPEQYAGYKLGAIYCKREKMSSLINNESGFDGEPVRSPFRVKEANPDRRSMVEQEGAERYAEGLSGRTIALWPSHGRHYDNEDARWEWQRPCLFQTVEDLLSASFVIDWLAPMLENAGAYIMMPRERDVNPVEIIVDNDGSRGYRGRGLYSEKGVWRSVSPGFADTLQYYSGHDNPFGTGTARSTECVSSSKSRKAAGATWSAVIPRRDRYAVYVSWQSFENSTESAHYTVRHLGGSSHFLVNQKMGGGTWIYLGTFEFAEGDAVRVELDNITPKGRKFTAGSVVSADAVKIGGGMGNIARKTVADSLGRGEVSGLPRYTEGARYWLQWAGMDSTVFSHHEEADDYRDDLFARGAWVDALSGGSKSNPRKEGRRIPIDLSFAFHSDAGVTSNDSTIGTLVIYSRKNEHLRKYPNGEDRLGSREYADIVQSQVVHDLRSCIDSSWNRRQIRDRAYRESRTTPVPTILLESFSHQNFADMRYALDPRFKFVLSRAIYKGMVKYLSNRYGCAYEIQPLPVNSFAAVIANDSTACLSWRETEDKMEATAAAKAFRLYTRTGDGAFDGGRRIGAERDADGRYHAEVRIEKGKIYSYKVCATNDGGESFPSEILSLGITGERDFRADSIVLVVNNFTRVSAPAWFDTPQYAGFDNDADAGVPYMREIAFTGRMHEFRRDRQWLSNDAPGFGASHSDMAGKVVGGNTFDYPYVHGRAIMRSGYSFCSMSAAAFCETSAADASAAIRHSEADSPMAIDLICGRQVSSTLGAAGGRADFSVFPAAMQEAIRRYSESGSNLLISGAYIATDIWDCVYPTAADSAERAGSIRFAEEVLGYSWAANHASRSACTPSPDGIVPASKEHGSTIYRYEDSGISAIVYHSSPDNYKVISIGFPIEEMKEGDDIYRIMNYALNRFRQ